MIRPFERIDARRLRANEYSHTFDMEFVFDDPNFYKHTLIDEDQSVKAIICFARYWKNNFLAFFLVSEDLERADVKELKHFIYQAAHDLNADRIQTDSIANEKLDKWHEFLGFKWEGKREKMIYNQDYHCWAMLKGRDF